MYRKASLCQIFTVRCGRQIPAAIGLCVWGQPLFPRDLRIFQYFSFSVLRQGVQAAHSVLHQRRHWMSAGDIWPDQSDVPAMRPFRFLNSVIHSQRRPYSICHCLKHVWVQRPFHEQKITNQYEPREQTFCLTSVLPAEIPSWPCRDPGWARQLSHHLWDGSVRSWSEPSVFTIPKYLGEYETYPTGLGLIFHFSSCPPLWVIRRNRLFLHAFLVWIYTAWNTSLIVFGPHSECLRTSLWMSLMGLNFEVWIRFFEAFSPCWKGGSILA